MNSTERLIALSVVVLGTAMAGQGLVMIVAPGWFFDTFGAFGERNDHYVRDLATWFLALAVMLLASARRAEWSVPVLLLAATQVGLHLVNHVLDVHAGRTLAIGVANVAALTLLAIVYALLAAQARSAEVAR